MSRTAQTWRSNVLLKAVVVLMAASPLASLLLEESPMPFFVRFTGWIFWCTTLIPAYSYLRTRPELRTPIPFFPLIGLLFGLYYALPAALGSYGMHWAFKLDPRVDYNEAAGAALLGWLLLMAGYQAVHARATGANRTYALQIEGVLAQYAAFVMTVAGIAIDVLRRTASVSAALGGVLQFAVTVAWFGTAMLVVLALRQKLNRWQKLLLWTTIIVNIGLQAGTGSVSNLALYFAVIILAIWVELRYLKATWVALAIVGALVVCSMRGVAADFRAQVWYGSLEIQGTQRSVIMAKLLGDRIAADGLYEVISTGVSSVATRSANLDLLADVMRRTPDQVPYWRGETYISLVGIAIPRILWPDKPTKDLGQQFGHRYGYVGARDFRTSVNLPYIVELYANFGMVGLLIGMFLIGMLYATIERYTNQPGQPMSNSLVGVALLVPLFNVESDFSLIFGGLFLNGVALRLMLLAIRSASTSRVAAPSRARRLESSPAQSGLRSARGR